MAKTIAKAAQENQSITKARAPLSLEIAKRGVSTSKDFACLMSALMCDLIEGKITPGVGNVTVKAGNSLLKVVEMQMKYGQTGSGTAERVLSLTGVSCDETPQIQ